jgi:hypothetical protein
MTAVVLSVIDVSGCKVAASWLENTHSETKATCKPRVIKDVLGNWFCQLSALLMPERVIHLLPICSPLPASPCLLPSGSLRCSDGFIYFPPYVPVFPSLLEFDEVFYLLAAHFI